MDISLNNKPMCYMSKVHFCRDFRCLRVLDNLFRRGSRKSCFSVGYPVQLKVYELNHILSNCNFTYRFMIGGARGGLLLLRRRRGCRGRREQGGRGREDGGGPHDFGLGGRMAEYRTMWSFVRGFYHSLSAV